jgi:hypothetical protein
VVVDLDGRAQLQSHVADDVVSLHQQQGRTVDFLPIGKKGKKKEKQKGEKRNTQLLGTICRFLVSITLWRNRAACSSNPSRLK